MTFRNLDENAGPTGYDKKAKPSATRVFAKNNFIFSEVINFGV